MNIACTACSARYGVADEKLVGKRVRITCKRCGTVLIVDGNYNPPTVSASTSIAPSPPISSRPPVESRRPAPPPEPPFMVAFGDGRQEQADVAQIVRFHRAGQLGTDSVVWREGMANWSDPWDVPEISAAFRRMGYARPTPAPSSPPAASPLYDSVGDSVEEEATQIHRSAPRHAAPHYEDSEDTHVVDSSSRGSPARLRDVRAAARHVVEDDDVPTHVGAPAHGLARRSTPSPREAERPRRVSSQPASRESTAEEYQRARREAKALNTARARSSRPAGNPSRPPPDMFARHSRAGSEEEQVEQAELGAGYEPDGPRLTGARNETSVLFSLDSLLKPEAKKSAPPPRPVRRDESLLVDDGASLPVGGGIAPALSAPDFNAPVSAPPPPRLNEPLSFDGELRGRSSRAWLYLFVLVAFGAGGALAWKTGALQPLLVQLGLSTPPLPPVPVPTATATATPTPPAAESASAAASASAAVSASASAAVPSASAPMATGAPARPTAPAPVAARPPSTGTPTSATPKAAATGTREAPSVPKEAPAAANEEPAAKEAPASSGASAPFDPAAAKEALAGATANVASCKEMGGPTGNGRVSITFAPSGRPTSVAVTGDLAGTTVGSCIARLYRAVRVPAFTGDSVTVAKGFTVQ
jgi:predicted Zn finger-like uncharacterized protein